MYDATLGRFLQRDPVGLAGGDVNVYAYCFGQPTGQADSQGLAPDWRRVRTLESEVITGAEFRWKPLGGALAQVIGNFLCPCGGKPWQLQVRYHRATKVEKTYKRGYSKEEIRDIVAALDKLIAEIDHFIADNKSRARWNSGLSWANGVVGVVVTIGSALFGPEISVAGGFGGTFAGLLGLEGDVEEKSGNIQKEIERLQGIKDAISKEQKRLLSSIADETRVESLSPELMELLPKLSIQTGTPMYKTETDLIPRPPTSWEPLGDYICSGTRPATPLPIIGSWASIADLMFSGDLRRAVAGALGLPVR
jgi:hypothetical protein